MKCELFWDHAGWDEAVARSPAATVFHRRFWLELGAELTGTTTGCVLVTDGRMEVLGGVPYLEGSSWSGRHLVLPPVTPFNGPFVCADARRKNDAVSRQEERAMDVLGALAKFLPLRLDEVSLFCSPAMIDVRPFLWAGWEVGVRYSYWVPLIGSVEERFDSFRYNVRKHIVKGLRDSGLEVHPAAGRDASFEVWERTFRRHGTDPPLSAAQFARVLHALDEQGVCRGYVAYRAGKQVAFNVAVVDRDKRTLYDFVAGSDPEELPHGTATYLKWRTMRDEWGKCLRFDFMGADVRSIARYKAAFNGEIVPSYVISKRGSWRARVVEGVSRLARFQRPLAERSVEAGPPGRVR